MNENIDLTKILKDCPEGWKFYSLVHEEVEFQQIEIGFTYPIVIKAKHNNIERLVSDGRLYSCYSGECILFPSKDQRDWSKFSAPWYKKEKFDPNTLKSFDKVLVSNCDGDIWRCSIFSHIYGKDNLPSVCNGIGYKYCIPYNDDTKHLAGTMDDPPEYYRYWEE